jgi:hypothetical protein
VYKEEDKNLIDEVEDKDVREYSFFRPDSSMQGVKKEDIALTKKY